MVELSELNMKCIEGNVVVWLHLVSALVRVLEKRTGMFATLMVQRHAALIVVVAQGQRLTTTEQAHDLVAPRVVRLFTFLIITNQFGEQEAS